MTATLTPNLTASAAAVDFTARDGFGDPIDFDGTCPVCRETYGLDETGRVPDHRVPGGRANRPQCTGSAALGLDPHRAPFFYVEGVRWP